MLKRILEPEVMDSPEDAREYDAMDHTAVNQVFVTDFLTALTDWSLQRPVNPHTPPLRILDLGAGTAQITIELAHRAPNIHITAVDAAESMLALANKNIAAAGLSNRITTVLADAKQLPFDSEEFDVVISNSIVHHLAEPKLALAEAIRVTSPRGLLFHRDLARPNNEAALQQIVDNYAADSTFYQRRLFADSLRAALTIDETADLVASLGFATESVGMSSDRHWTWVAKKT